MLAVILAASAGASDDLSTEAADAVRKHVGSIEADRSNIFCGTITLWAAQAIDEHGEAGWALAEQETQDSQSVRDLRERPRRKAK